MIFDPFNAPISGRSSQDLFGGPVARRPLSLPGGDLFAPSNAAQGPSLADGNITPTIEVEIAGDPAGRRKDIKNFTLRDDIQSLYDPFSFSMVNPKGELNYLIEAIDQRHHVPIRIYHRDPFVNSGEPRLWTRGVILRGQSRSGFGGSMITLSGYDLGWLLTSCAPFGRDMNLQGLSWPRMCQKLIDPSWLQPGTGVGKLSGSNGYGLRSIIGVSTAREIRQGRINAQTEALRQEQALAARTANRQEITIANNLNTRAVMPKIMVQPGETVGDILIRYAKLEDSPRFVNVTPDGDLCFFRPDYTTAPQYVYKYNFDESLADLNNVLDGGRDVDGSNVSNLVECVGSLLYKMVIAETDNPMEGLTTGFAKHYDAAVDYYLRRLTFSDDQRYTPGRAEKRATWRYKQGLYGSETVTFTVQGHSQNGLAFASNSRADVRSDKLAVNRVLYQSAVEYHQTEEGGGIRSTTTITLKKDKLWTA